ncbi:MAG TPA: GNAT family N-acetyltransferase [Actinomycetales bacterium]|nr:GNAT family N-acetyltransferase [Actinomycetales bacterium]
MLVRSAVPEDIEAIAACHVACWREAYADLLSAGYLAELDPADFRVRWAASLADPSRPSWVAEDDGRVVGFSGTCPSRDQPPVRQLELRCLYLRRDYQGGGLAQQLLDRALGDVAASLWVAEDNPRARAFYTRNGFRPDGARASLQQMEGLTEVRLVR